MKLRSLPAGALVKQSLVTALAVVLGAFFQAAHAQVVRGTVLDSASGIPLSNVMITLIDTTGSVISAQRTTREGRFKFTPTTDAITAVYSRGIGWQPSSSGWLTAWQGDTLEITLRLQPIATQLSEVVIRAERDSMRRYGSVFGLRIASLGGKYVTPSEVAQAAMSAPSYIDIVGKQAFAGYYVACQDRNCSTRCVASLRDRGACLMVVVDNMRMEPEQAIDAAPPELIDYIVVLKSSEAGVLFGTGSSAGVLAIFTKRGPRR